MAKSLAVQRTNQTRKRSKRFDWVTRLAEDEADLISHRVQFEFKRRDEGNLSGPGAADDPSFSARQSLTRSK